MNPDADWDAVMLASPYDVGLLAAAAAAPHPLPQPPAGLKHHLHHQYDGSTITTTDDRTRERRGKQAETAPGSSSSSSSSAWNTVSSTGTGTGTAAGHSGGAATTTTTAWETSANTLFGRSSGTKFDQFKLTLDYLFRETERNLAATNQAALTASYKHSSNSDTLLLPSQEEHSAAGIAKAAAFYAATTQRSSQRERVLHTAHHRQRQQHHHATTIPLERENCRRHSNTYQRRPRPEREEGRHKDHTPKDNGPTPTPPPRSSSAAAGAAVSRSVKDIIARVTAIENTLMAANKANSTRPDDLNKKTHCDGAERIDHNYNRIERLTEDVGNLADQMKLLQQQQQALGVAHVDHGQEGTLPLVDRREDGRNKKESDDQNHDTSVAFRTRILNVMDTLRREMDTISASQGGHSVAIQKVQQRMSGLDESLVRTKQEVKEAAAAAARAVAAEEENLQGDRDVADRIATLSARMDDVPGREATTTLVKLHAHQAAVEASVQRKQELLEILREEVLEAARSAAREEIDNNSVGGKAATAADAVEKQELKAAVNELRAQVTALLQEQKQTTAVDELRAQVTALLQEQKQTTAVDELRAQVTALLQEREQTKAQVVQLSEDVNRLSQVAAAQQGRTEAEPRDDGFDEEDVERLQDMYHTLTERVDTLEAVHTTSTAAAIASPRPKPLPASEVERIAGVHIDRVIEDIRSQIDAEVQHRYIDRFVAKSDLDLRLDSVVRRSDVAATDAVRALRREVARDIDALKRSLEARVGDLESVQEHLSASSEAVEDMKTRFDELSKELESTWGAKLAEGQNKLVSIAHDEAENVFIERIKKFETGYDESHARLENRIEAVRDVCAEQEKAYERMREQTHTAFEERIAAVAAATARSTSPDLAARGDEVARSSDVTAALSDVKTLYARVTTIESTLLDRIAVLPSRSDVVSMCQEAHHQCAQTIARLTSDVTEALQRSDSNDGSLDDRMSAIVAERDERFAVVQLRMDHAEREVKCLVEQLSELKKNVSSQLNIARSASGDDEEALRNEIVEKLTGDMGQLSTAITELRASVVQVQGQCEEFHQKTAPKPDEESSVADDVMGLKSSLSQLQEHVFLLKEPQVVDGRDASDYGRYGGHATVSLAFSCRNLPRLTAKSNKVPNSILSVYSKAGHGDEKFRHAGQTEVQVGTADPDFADAIVLHGIRGSMARAEHKICVYNVDVASGARIRKEDLLGSVSFAMSDWIGACVAGGESGPVELSLPLRASENIDPAIVPANATVILRQAPMATGPDVGSFLSSVNTSHASSKHHRRRSSVTSTSVSRQHVRRHSGVASLSRKLESVAPERRSLFDSRAAGHRSNAPSTAGGHASVRVAKAGDTESELITCSFRCHNLPMRDKSNKPDPIVAVYAKAAPDDKEFMAVGQTERLRAVTSPSFSQTVTFGGRIVEEKRCELGKIVVYDAVGENVRPEDRIGSAVFKLEDLMDRSIPRILELLLTRQGENVVGDGGEHAFVTVGVVGDVAAGSAGPGDTKAVSKAGSQEDDKSTGLCDKDVKVTDNEVKGSGASAEGPDGGHVAAAAQQVSVKSQESTNKLVTHEAVNELVKQDSSASGDDIGTSMSQEEAELFISKTAKASIGMIIVRLTKKDQEGIQGLLVTTIHPSQSAEAAGLRLGDIITAIEGTHVNSTKRFFKAFGNARPGDVLSFSILRGYDAEAKPAQTAEDLQKLVVQIRVGAKGFSLEDVMKIERKAKGRNGGVTQRMLSDSVGGQDNFAYRDHILELAVRCTDLPLKSGKCDPVVVVYHRLKKKQEFEYVGKTEFRETTTSPVFSKHVQIPLLSNHQFLNFNVYDVCADKLRTEDLLGGAVVSLGSLMSAFESAKQAGQNELALKLLSPADFDVNNDEALDLSAATLIVKLVSITRVIPDNDSSHAEVSKAVSHEDSGTMVNEDGNAAPVTPMRSDGAAQVDSGVDSEMEEQMEQVENLSRRLGRAVTAMTLSVRCVNLSPSVLTSDGATQSAPALQGDGLSTLVTLQIPGADGEFTDVASTEYISASERSPRFEETFPVCFDKAAAEAREIHVRLCVYRASPSSSTERVLVGLMVANAADLMLHPHAELGYDLTCPDNAEQHAALEQSESRIVLSAAVASAPDDIVSRGPTPAKSIFHPTIQGDNQPQTPAGATTAEHVTSTMTMTAQQEDGGGALDVTVACANLPKIEWLRKVSPVVVLWERDASTGEFRRVAQTERISQNDAPQFLTTFRIALSGGSVVPSPTVLAPGDGVGAGWTRPVAAREFKFVVHDVPNAGLARDDDSLGFVHVFMPDLMLLAAPATDGGQKPSLSLDLDHEDPKKSSRLKKRKARIIVSVTPAPWDVQPLEKVPVQTRDEMKAASLDEVSWPSPQTAAPSPSTAAVQEQNTDCAVDTGHSAHEGPGKDEDLDLSLDF